MSRWLLCAALLVGCSDDRRVAPLGPPSSGMQCTKIGCSDGFAVRGALYLGVNELPPEMSLRLCRADDCSFVHRFTTTGATRVSGSVNGSFTVSRTLSDGVFDFDASFAVPKGTTTDGDTWRLDIYIGESAHLASTSIGPLHYETVWPNGRACDGPSGYSCQVAQTAPMLGCDSANACERGKTETDTACTVPGHVRTRRCNDACAWSDWSVCGAWRDIAPAPDGLVSREGFFSAWVADRALIGAGWSAGKNVLDLWSYDPKEDTWARLPAPTGTQCSGRSGVLDGILYVMCDVAPAAFDVGAGSWTVLPPPPEGLVITPSDFEIAEMRATHEVLFLSMATSEGAAYDTKARTWRRIAHHPHSVCYGLVPAGDRVACDPQISTFEVDLYDPVLDHWSSSVPPRDDVAFFSSRDRPFEIGRGPEALHWSELDLTTLAWSDSTPIPPTILSGRFGTRRMARVHGRPIAWEGTADWHAAVLDAAGSSFQPAPDGMPAFGANSAVIMIGDETLFWNGASRTGRILSIE